MDYMFKGVNELYSVNMESQKNCKILSMISTFEGCMTLNNFTIEGFDVSNLLNKLEGFVTKVHLSLF